MQQVLVTGATGFIGIEVAEQLCRKGFKPRLLVRRPHRANFLHGLLPDAELMQGDLEGPLGLARAVEGVDTVIHLGARAVFEEYKRLRSSIVDGSTFLMRAAVAAGVKTFVYASSMLVYGANSGVIDPGTPVAPMTGYGRAKVETEAALRTLAEASGMNLAIVRLPHVYGARDFIFGQVHRGRVILPGSGRNLFSHLHVQDAARLLIAAAENGRHGSSPVADDLAVSWNDFFDEIRNYYPHFRRIRMPRWMALAGTCMLTPFHRLSRQPSMSTPQAVRAWNMTLTVKKGVFWDELGLKPDYPTIHEGIPAVMDACLQFRWIHSIDDHIA
ncbi:MAG: hypothetical protein A2498_10105 [Lentisphaerae bacterium RIFOXYC12_FULL_60_16]|nr:MAG: hypothetical protein A2498_10105 [Lentisphaerae bacterium RIFOXYC12_FULL_60_16]OGV84785.1 MAG: hypothetical protein A2340_04505 [Lentisphaerae bacterium RIFOXYB12_FULL_60_10]